MRHISDIKKNRGTKTQTSFHLQSAMALLIAVTALFGSLSAARAGVKIVTAGNASMTDIDFGVVRYNSDGSLDTSFDSDGIVTTDVSGADQGYAVAIQSDGKIVVAGYSGSTDFAVVLYNSDGSLNTTFNLGGALPPYTAGKVTTPIGSSHGCAVSSVSGNRVVLNGQTAVRYPTAILSKRADAGANQIYVYNASGLGTGDSLSLGNETLFVTAVDDQSAEHSITVDTDLEITGNQGIGRAYPAGTKINPIPVFRVTAVHYTIDPYTGSLLREDKAEVAGGGAAAELAGNIQDITITPEDPSADLNDQRSYTVTLTARPKNPDPEYWQNGGYRLRALSSVVALRNP